MEIFCVIVAVIVIVMLFYDGGITAGHGVMGSLRHAAAEAVRKEVRFESYSKANRMEKLETAYDSVAAELVNDKLSYWCWLQTDKARTFNLAAEEVMHCWAMMEREGKGWRTKLEIEEGEEPVYKFYFTYPKLWLLDRMKDIKAGDKLLIVDLSLSRKHYLLTETGCFLGNLKVEEERDFPHFTDLCYAWVTDVEEKKDTVTFSCAIYTGKNFIPDHSKWGILFAGVC